MHIDYKLRQVAQEERKGNHSGSERLMWDKKKEYF